MRTRTITAAVWLFLFIFLGCSDNFRINPIMPTDGDSDLSEPGPSNSFGIQWSPYIVIHTPGEAFFAYQKAIPELMSRGALKGARVGIIKGENRNEVNVWIASTGLDVLWILDNYYLFESDIERVIDRVLVWYPNIRYLQIGNEVTTILPRNGPQISVEAYMSVLKKIYTYVATKYPQITLVTQSTFGSGSYGSVELERMIELGLKTMSSSRLIIGMNVYSVSTASQYSHVINGPLRGYRIWITETGTTNPNEHIQYVNGVYPILRNNLRAERIYWYCLYCGDNGPDVGFGLIRDLQKPSFWTSPLYDFLAGRR